MVFNAKQIRRLKETCTAQVEATASMLLERGVSKEIIAAALTNDKTSIEGKDLLSMLGIGREAPYCMPQFFLEYKRSAYSGIVFVVIFMFSVLLTGTIIFFRKRLQLYLQAENVIGNYINGDYSHHLPRNNEGDIFRLFSLVDELSTMLQSKNDTGRRAKEFLKNTISDISHQLKTPLSALIMYNEIIENEPDNIETVKRFSAKIGESISRIEQLIQSMLKITRLDTESIVFEKENHSLTELIAFSISELTTRAENEGKQILVDGNPDQQILCDMEWTGEAIGNIVKNALDHTITGGIIRIMWERTPGGIRIFISDNGDGIAPEDIYHVFKRFYRSRNTQKTPGIGLGLSLAKSIIEGQGGIISVRSEAHCGTTFILSFLTEL